MDYLSRSLLPPKRYERSADGERYCLANEYR